jgi:hypothetical protein
MVVGTSGVRALWTPTLLWLCCVSVAAAAALFSTAATVGIHHGCLLLAITPRPLLWSHLWMTVMAVQAPVPWVLRLPDWCPPIELCLKIVAMCNESTAPSAWEVPHLHFGRCHASAQLCSLGILRLACRLIATRLVVD